MNNSAVIDIGSLKVKFFIFNAARELVQSGSILTLLSKGLDETGIISSTSLDKLDAALDEISSIVGEYKARDNVRVIGTEALRKASNAELAHLIAKRHFGIKTIEIIDQQREAELFFRAVGLPFANVQIAALDVGGGSVQLTIGSYDATTRRHVIDAQHHTTTGSYRIQQKYSPRNDVVSPHFNNARRTVSRAFAQFDSSPTETLVFGSTCILDMLQASGAKLYHDRPLPHHPVYTTIGDLRALLRHIRTLPPQERTHLYPNGGSFMYGADYLLLNVIEAARKTEAVYLYPSNYNGAYALANEAETAHLAPN